MNVLISMETDIGNNRKTNQDSMAVLTADSSKGKIVFAIICDGMGGLAKGEIASATLVNAFVNWFETELSFMLSQGITDYTIRNAWQNLIDKTNQLIKNYGVHHNINLGTTITVVLICSGRYYCLNVGDSRLYILSDRINQITEDQTVVAREVKYGRLTKSEAQKDPRKSVLLQCVGASKDIKYDMYFGEVKSQSAFLLCSDGFRNQITEDEIFNRLNPMQLTAQEQMSSAIKELIELSKARMEKDNISAILLKFI